MKKIALYIGLAILLLFLIFIIIPAEENTGLGNVPGNSINGGYFAQDEDFIYYKTNAATYSESGVYKVNKKSFEMTKIKNGSVSELNITKDSIYYAVGAPGAIWKMSKNGNFSRPVLLTQATNIVISDDRIYYRLTLCDGIWVKTEWLKPYVGSLYSCDLNGRDKKLISKEEILNFVVDGDKIYYTDHTDNYSIWRMDTSGENKEKLHSRESTEPEYCVPNFDEKYLYFIADDCLYRMDKNTLQKEVLLKDNFSEMIVYGDSIFFSTADERGIYRLSKDGKEKELLIGGGFPGFNVAENSLIIYYNNGLHRFDIETRELTKLSAD